GSARGTSRPRQLRSFQERSRSPPRRLPARGPGADLRSVRPRVRVQRRVALPDACRQAGCQPQRPPGDRFPAAPGRRNFPDQPLQPRFRRLPNDARGARFGFVRGGRSFRARLIGHARPLLGTRGSMPVALTAADVRDKLAQALVAADGRRFESFGAAYDFAQRELPFALTHTFGGHSSCVELETGANEYFVCDMGSGARPFGAHVLARQGGRPATVNVFMSRVHWARIM